MRAEAPADPTPTTRHVRLPWGATVEEDGVHYRVWAPVVRTVEVEILRGETVARRFSLAPSPDGSFCGRDEGGRVGDTYRYRLDGAGSVPDPASRWQPQGVHGPSLVVDPHAYPWTDRSFRRPAFRDLVIYELHVGTFSEAGTFRGVIAHLPHLQALGVNAIELMPIADFPGERNWGYDGVLLYAPARAYGRPDDLRALVNAAHAAGIAVILDVVYNHFGPDGNYLGQLIGDYLDEETKTPWGGAIRYGSAEFHGLRELVLANPGYWMTEFHIDGFRLDATHEIVAPSPRHLLAELAAIIHARGGYVIAEDERNEAQLIRPPEEGGVGFDAVWADDFHHVIHVAQTGERHAYFADYHGTAEELAICLRDGWLYQGQVSPRQQAPRGTSCGDLPPQRFIHCISNHDQVGNRALGERATEHFSDDGYRAASALLCLSPYTPMLFMGQEWGASTPFLFFTDHEDKLGALVTAGRRDEFRHFPAFGAPEDAAKIPDPQAGATFRASKLRWDEVAEPPHDCVLALYVACLTIRRKDEAFRPTTRTTWRMLLLDPGVGAIWLRSTTTEWLMLVHLQQELRGVLELPPPVAGRQWQRMMSTRERRFGGDGASGLAPDLRSVRFDRAELLLLASV